MKGAFSLNNPLVGTVRPPELFLSDKNPFSVRKISVRDSGAGNGCVNFVDASRNAFFLQEKPMSIKFLVLGGVFWVLGVPILFLWARGFF